MPKFQVISEYQPSGDQPEAIEALSQGIEMGLDEQTLLGVTGSGKTFTMAKIIEKVQRPTLVLAHNHISNLAFPSETDWVSTDTARAVLAGIGLELIDHIVFVDDDAVSMKESKNYRGRRSCYLL